MGFFSVKEKCAVCDEEVGLNRYQLRKDVWLCPKCFKKTGGLSNFNKIKNMSGLEIKKLIEQKEEKENNFEATKKISTYLYLDEKHKQWAIPEATITGKVKSLKIFDYSEIIDFELIEDGTSITKGGIGRALVGGAIFGGVGAIVGGTTGKKKTKTTCSKLQIKITLNNMENPIEYINFIQGEIKTDGVIYRTFYNYAQQVLSALQIICNKNQMADKEEIKSPTYSKADEILKLKRLLDEGIITEEEFQKEKQNLLK